MTFKQRILATAGITLGLGLCQACSMFGADDVAYAYGDDTATTSHRSAKATNKIMDVAAPTPLGLTASDDGTKMTKLVSTSLSLDGSAPAPTPTRFGTHQNDWARFVAEDDGTQLAGFSAPDGYGDNLITDLSWSSDPALSALTAARTARDFYEPYEQRVLDISAAIDFEAHSAQTGLAFDLGFSPRASLREDGNFTTRSIGAEVRLGQNFDQRGSNVSSGSWYVFAGADGEALIWETGKQGLGLDLVNIEALKLRDRVTVGDIQAGVSVERFGGQFSVSYIRREVEYRQGSIEIDRNENFAGLSFSLRR